MSLDLDLIIPELNFRMDKSNTYKVYEFEDFRLDVEHLMLYQRNEEIALPPKAVETLRVFVERRGKILSKDELMASIWTDSIVEESNLAQYLHVLRKTLGDQKNGKPIIETLRRRGYRFNAPVAVSEGGNGFLRRSMMTGVSDDGFQTHSAAPQFRVERRGNVLAVADWRENERRPAPIPPSIEESETQQWRGRGIYIAAILFAALSFGSLSLIWSGFGSRADAPVKSDLSVSNLTNGEDVDHATISNDGNYFAYSSHDGEKTHLWIQQTGQSSRLEIIEPFAGGIYGTTFTPDSKFVYFVADDRGSLLRALYRVPTLGGVKTKVLDDITVPVSFSPDGGEMVYARGHGGPREVEMVIASIDGKRERVLLAHAKDAAETFGPGAWSPDGKLIAYGAMDTSRPGESSCSIVAIDPKSGEKRPLSPEKWDTCYRMAWTHDAQGLVFIGTKAKEAFSTRRDQVYYLSIADGVSRRLTTDGNRHQAVSLGVTQRDEILAVPFSRQSQIWVMDASGDSRTALQITKGLADGRGGIATLSDHRVSYLTRHGEGFSIWLMDDHGEDRKQLTTDPSEIEELRASPDGSILVFSARRDGINHLYAVDANGANLRQLTFGDTQEIDSTVSPDGRWVVYDSLDLGSRKKRSLWKISTDGGSPVRFSDIDCMAPHYSPDGEFVSCVSPDWKKISIISTENGREIKTIEPAEFPMLNIGARWTPDSRSLAYIVANNGVGNIRTQPIDGDATSALTDFTSGTLYNFDFSTDGTRLFVARGYPTRNALLIKNFR